MSFYHNKVIKAYGCFLVLFCLLLIGAGLTFQVYQADTVKAMFLLHDEAVVSSLLEQGISKDVIAVALTNTDISTNGEKLTYAIGIGQNAGSDLPFITQFQHISIYSMIVISLLLIAVLFWGHFYFPSSGNGYMSKQKQSFVNISTVTTPATYRKTAKVPFPNYLD